MSKKTRSTWNWKKWHLFPIIVIGTAACVILGHFVARAPNLILLFLFSGLEGVTFILTITLVVEVKSQISSRKEGLQGEMSNLSAHFGKDHSR